MRSEGGSPSARRRGFGTGVLGGGRHGRVGAFGRRTRGRGPAGDISTRARAGFWGGLLLLLVLVLQFVEPAVDTALPQQRAVGGLALGLGANRSVEYEVRDGVLVATESGSGQPRVLARNVAFAVFHYRAVGGGVVRYLSSQSGVELLSSCALGGGQ